MYKTMLMIFVVALFVTGCGETSSPVEEQQAKQQEDRPKPAAEQQQSEPGTDAQANAQAQLDLIQQGVENSDPPYIAEQLEPLSAEDAANLPDDQTARAMLEIQILRVTVDRGAGTQRFVDKQFAQVTPRRPLQSQLAEEGYSASIAEITEFQQMRTAPEE